MDTDTLSVFNPWRINLNLGMRCAWLDMGVTFGLLPVYKTGVCEHNFHEFGGYIGF